MPVEDKDEHVVDDVLAGNKDAFDELVLKYQRQMAALVIRMTGYHADVADTVQRIFVKAFTKLPTFKRKSTFKTWLYAIGMNTCRNDLRKIARQRHEEEVEEAGLEAEGSMEADLLEKQRRHQLQDALKSLPERQLETVTLRIYQELSFREIGDVLGTTENTAKVNFHHGMKRLRELVKD